MSFHHMDASPPSYSHGPTLEVPILVPTVPSRNNRYNESPKPHRKEIFRVIPAKTRVKTRSEGKPGLVDGWKEWQHPEGDVYAFQLKTRLLTSADVRNEQIRHLLDLAMNIVLQKLGLGDLRPIEIYMNPILNSSEPVPTIEYYLVDHQARQIFWLDDVSTQSVGIPDYDTPGYLKSFLTPEYWTHVDYFPMHMREEDLKLAEDELIVVLAHGRLDAMTSPGSTCPYSAEECSQYLSILDLARRYSGPEVIGYRVACVARLWNAMARARHINNFGLDNPRLDRLQGFYEYRDGAYTPSFKLSLLEGLTFLIAVPIWDRLMNLFNGRVVFQRHWAVFFKDMRRNWLLMGGISAATLMCDIILLASRVTTIPTAASASFASAALFTAVYLHLMHPEHELSTGPEISSYVMKYESYYHGLRPLSIALALPQALTIYAAILLLWGVAVSTVEQAPGFDEAAYMVAAFAIGAIPILIISSFFAPTTPRRPSVWNTLFSRHVADDPNKRQG